MLPKKTGKYRFDEFEVDFASRALRRDGRFVAISPKTFDLLAFFVHHPGRLVTQDELLHALWPNATMEESNLNQHIFLLRKALSGIDPGEKLLLTVPRKGFKFTASVTKVESAEPVEFRASESAPGQSPVNAAMAVEPGRHNPIEATLEAPDLPFASAARRTDSGSEDLDEDRAAHPQAASWKLAAFCAGLVLLALIGWGSWRWIGGHWLHPAGSHSFNVVIGDFENTTGHHELDNSIRAVLSTELEQSPFFGVATEASVAHALGHPPGQGNEEEGHAQSSERQDDLPGSVKAASQDGRQGDSPKAGHSGPASSEPETFEAPSTSGVSAAPMALTAVRARQVCHSLKDQAYLTGSVHRLALKYLVHVQAFNCASGKMQAETRGIADTPDGVVAVLAKVAADMRKQLGEPDASIQRFSKPLFTSTSATAVEDYAEAVADAAQGKPDDAILLLQRTTELDPQSALAFAALGTLQANLGQHDLAASALGKAFELRNQVDDRHRLLIVSAYHDQVTGDLNASIRNDNEWIGLYPRDPAPYADLADLQIQVGKPGLALQPAREAVQLNPDDALSYVVLARAQMHMGQFEEAAATCRQAIRRHLDVAPIHNFLLQIAFLRLDQPAMDEQFAWAKGRPSEPYMMLQQALIDFAMGKVKAAQVVMANVVAAYRKQGETERADRMMSQVPRIEAELGMLESATALLPRLPAIPGSTDIPVAWADVGQTARAETMRARELNDHPGATLWQEYSGPQIAAAIAMSQHQPEAAIQDLEPASRYDLRSFEAPAMRGRAYLADSQPAFAEAEFHRILDHPGIEPFSHNYPLAQLGLARSLAAQDKTVDAGFAYKVLFSIWKDADPDLPRLREAKAEYARLNSSAMAAQARPMQARPVAKSANAAKPSAGSKASATNKPHTYIPLNP